VTAVPAEEAGDVAAIAFPMELSVLDDMVGEAFFVRAVWFHTRLDARIAQMAPYL